MSKDLLRKYTELSCKALRDSGFAVGSLAYVNPFFKAAVVCDVPHGPVLFELVCGSFSPNGFIEVEPEIFCTSLREAIRFSSTVRKDLHVDNHLRVIVFPCAGLQETVGRESYVLEIPFRGDPNDFDMLQEHYHAALSLNLLPAHFNQDVVADPMYPFARYKVEDLWVLVFEEYPIGLHVAKIYDPSVVTQGVVLNTRLGTWTYVRKGDSRNLDSHEIGCESFGTKKPRFGVIGVYDRTNPSHMYHMLKAGRFAVNERD
jgi:hypothetical protein